MSPELALAIVALVAGPFIALLHWLDNHQQLNALKGIEVTTSMQLKLSSSSGMLREAMRL